MRQLVRCPQCGKSNLMEISLATPTRALCAACGATFDVSALVEGVVDAPVSAELSTDEAALALAAAAAASSKKRAGSARRGGLPAGVTPAAVGGVVGAVVLLAVVVVSAVLLGQHARKRQLA